MFDSVRFITGITKAVVVAASVLTISLFVTSVARADNDSGSLPGMWALQFEVGRDFQLGSFEGATISMKRHCSESRALRMGLTIDARLSDVDDDERSPRIFDVVQTHTDDTEFSLDLTTLYTMYFAPLDGPTYFFGFGPTIGYWRHDRNVDEIRPGQTADYVVSTQYDEYELSAGIRAALGVEWFFARNMSLLAEYGAVLDYVYSEKEKHSHNTNTPEGTTLETIDRQLRFAPASVNFGLSVYF